MGATIRPASPAEAGRLSTLAFRSKASHGYPADFMEACRAELTYASHAIAAGGFEVLEADGEVQGFYALLKVSPDTWELDALFVEPDAAGHGYGRMLMEHAIDAARARGGARLVIQADPHAVGFYERMGAVRIGERPSASIRGRALPLLEIALARAPGPGVE
jgi:GNAT superfamily N-acetyltransferase